MDRQFYKPILPSVTESFRANTSEPLTESIMTMRSKPGSALIVKQGKKSFPSPLSKKQAESAVDEFGYSMKIQTKNNETKFELAKKKSCDFILNDSEQALLIPNEQIQKSEEKSYSTHVPYILQQG